MTEDIEQLNREIQSLKEKEEKKAKAESGAHGYNVAMTILTDLLGCIFIGCALGFLCQFLFKTSVLLTAGLTLLGGIAGLYTTVRYALQQERKNKE